MELATAIELGKLVTTVFAIMAALWAFHKWRIRDELFPRAYFEVDVNFVGARDGQIVCEISATLENKGVVPLKIKDITFVLRGLKQLDKLEIGGDAIRHQLNFHRTLAAGDFVPTSWDYTFIYPGVRTEYNFVTTIADDIEFVRIQGDFNYDDPSRSHHAAKVLRVPSFGQDKWPGS